MAWEDGPCRGGPWASMMAWAVLEARCKSDEKAWVTGPINADRVARWDARRRAWRTPWAVRGESRMPALGAVSLETEVVEKRKLTRGRRRCRLSRHGGREGDAWCQVIRAVVKCRALMRGKPNCKASCLGDALCWRSKAGSLVGKGAEEKSGAQRKFIGAMAGGARLTALTHWQNSRPTVGPRNSPGSRTTTTTTSQCRYRNKRRGSC